MSPEISARYEIEYQTFRVAYKDMNRILNVEAALGWRIVSTMMWDPSDSTNIVIIMVRDKLA